MRTARAALAGVLVVACGTPSGRREPASGAGAAPIVDAVIIDGVVDVDTDDIAEGLANHPPIGLIFEEEAPLDRLTLEIDRRRVESYLKAEGYFLAVVGPPVVEPAGDGRVTVRFDVDQGPPSTVSAVEIDGVPKESGATQEGLLASTGIEIGERFDYDEYEGAKERLRRSLKDHGHVFAKVQGKVHVRRNTDEASVRYRLAPGPLCRFGALSIETSGGLPRESVRARIDWTEGERFDPERLTVTKRRLYAMSSMDTVRFDYGGGEPRETVDVSVNASATRAKEVRLGGGVAISNVNTQLRARASYLHHAFLHPLNTLELELRPAVSFLGVFDSYAGVSVEAAATLTTEDFLKPRLIFINAATYQLHRLEAYSANGPKFRTSLGHPFFSDRLTAAVGLELRLQDLSSRLNPRVDAQTLAQIGLRERLTVGLVEPSVRYDSRDDPLNPRGGVQAEIGLQLGRDFSTSPGAFMRVGSSAATYVALGRRVVLAGKVRFGFSPVDIGVLPITDRYYGGGGDRHRGFVRRRLSPSLIDEDGEPVPVGGTTLLESNLELRVDLFRLFGFMLGVAAFVDAGDVVDRPEDLDLGRLHLATGGGLRYRTPIGPIRFDLGYRLNRYGAADPDPGNRLVFHFGLGEAF